MTPKFLQLTRFTSGTPIMVNPRRLNSFHEERRATAQPHIYCGTNLDFGRGETILVKESVEMIKKLLK